MAPHVPEAMQGGSLLDGALVLTPHPPEVLSTIPDPAGGQETVSSGVVHVGLPAVVGTHLDRLCQHGQLGSSAAAEGLSAEAHASKLKVDKQRVSHPPNTDPPEEPSAESSRTWLVENGLLPEGNLPDVHLVRRFKALSQCQFSDSVGPEARRKFLQDLLPMEWKLAANQFDIGKVKEQRYHYRLELANTTPIETKPMRLRPHEEAWLDVHLDELLAKGVIGPILPHEQPRCVTPLLLVPGVQSGQAYRVCQNLVPVNKRTDAHQYQLNDTRRYRQKLGRAKYVSMLDLKAGFYNIPFEKESSYLSTFITHRGKYRWLRMPMGLTQAPAHFQYVVESVLMVHTGKGPPVVVYLDDIAVYADTPEECLHHTLETIRLLTEAGFMINMKKSQLVQTQAKVLGHTWQTGGYWAPREKKLSALAELSDEAIARCNRASLYGLLNFYREYVPTFAEVTEPIRKLLGQDARPWTPEATAAVRTVLDRILQSPRWLNADPKEELRLEARLSPEGMAVVALQRDPTDRRAWLPVSSWGRRLEQMERLDSLVVLELKALREAAWKMADLVAFCKDLTMRVSPELRALLRVARRAHPDLQALLIDLSMYKPKFQVGGPVLAPEELQMEATHPDWEKFGQELLDSMHRAEEAVSKPAMLPPRSRFTDGPYVHVQFDGGSQSGVGTGGFVIINAKGQEVVRSGKYFGPGLTNNEAETFALREALACLVRLQRKDPLLNLPVRVFGDSQLLIRFLTGIFKKPSRNSIYEALETAKKLARKFKHIAYRHVPRTLNIVADDMARRALEQGADLAFWNGKVPEDAPPNQLEAVHNLHQPTPTLNWSGLPHSKGGYGAQAVWSSGEFQPAPSLHMPSDGWCECDDERPCMKSQCSGMCQDGTFLIGLDWAVCHPFGKSMQIGSVFGAQVASVVTDMGLARAQSAAQVRLTHLMDSGCWHDVRAHVESGDLASALVLNRRGAECLAAALGAPVALYHAPYRQRRRSLGTAASPEVSLTSVLFGGGADAVQDHTRAGTAGQQPEDQRPCRYCGQGHDQPRMVLCDRCSDCYHPECAQQVNGSRLHDGPWFCASCKGHLALHGPEDITQDFGLMDYLWTSELPQDPEEQDRILRLAEAYRAHGEELQVLVPTGKAGERWVDVPPLVTRQQLVVDTHDMLAHCGREKLIEALRSRYWWPGLHLDARRCLRTCATCQRDRPPQPLQEPLRWIDKGSAPLLGWSIDTAGPFPEDEDGNRFLFVAVDPFSKWVEVRPAPSSHSWRAAEFLYRDVVARWGKPRYVRTDNGAEYAGSFARLAKALGVVHNRITVGNSKANGQVERTIRTLKDALRRGLLRHPQSYWSDHLPAALMLLRFTSSRMTGLPPLTLLTARQPLLPSALIAPSGPPDDSLPEQEEAYLEALDEQVDNLHRIAGQSMREQEARIRRAMRPEEATQLYPQTFTHVQVGQLVLRRQRVFSKLDPRTSGPFQVVAIGGRYGQRVTIEPLARRGRRVTLHASKLVLYHDAEVQPADLDLGEPETGSQPVSQYGGAKQDPSPQTKRRRKA